MAVVQLADQRSVLAVLAAADSAKQLVAVLLQKTAEKLAFHSAEQLAAVVQPVTDKRMVGCIHTMGESLGLLVRLLLTMEILFLLTIAILAGSLQ